MEIHYLKLANRLIKVQNNQEVIVGIVYDEKLLNEIVCELNHGI